MSRDGDEFDLLRSCRRGDEASARALHALLAPELIVYARSILRDHALAEDAVQGVFLRLLRADGGTIDAVTDVRAWLTLQARREALSLLRSRQRAFSRERAAAATRSECKPDSPSTPTMHDEELTRAVDALPRRLREIIVLRHVSRMTFDQIASALSLNRNTAAARYRAALHRLRETLTRQTPLPEQTHVA